MTPDAAHDRGGPCQLSELDHHEQQSPMFWTILQDLKQSARELVLTDLLFKVVAFILLTPLVSLLYRLFLWAAGRTILADADIARFAVHPIGWLALTVVGGAFVGILALEQSALMAISLTAGHGRRLRVLDSLRFVTTKALGIYRISARMVVRLLILAAPFLAAGGGLYWLLLTDHDINFYLKEKPPRFWLAVATMGMILGILATLVIRCIVSWSVAMQLHLFEDVPAAECLARSQERVVGSRRTIARWVVIWFAINAIISLLASGIVLQLGQWVVPSANTSFWRLVLTLGMVLLFWWVVNLVTSLLAVISFAVMQGRVYDRFGRSAAFRLPGNDQVSRLQLTWTTGRIVAMLVTGFIAAALVGSMAIHTVRLDDDVEITAHRGASGKAPENTMASILQAIEDDADWVEIDVQESKDGVVVVAHDSDLKKVSGNAVKIWEATADELRRIDIGSYFGPEFIDARVPTLAEVLKACRGNVRVNIELKYYGHDQNLEQKVVDLVEEHDMAADVVVMSLKSAGIRKVKELRPNWTVGLLAAVAAGDLTRAEVDFLAVSTKLATRAFVRAAHHRGKAVHVWTVNDPVSMSTLIGRGVDNLITDHPDRARKLLQERAILSPPERVLLELASWLGAVPAQASEP